jgi:LysM repeat protein
MDNPRHDPDFEYDDYAPYPRGELTGVGLPPGQLALIIGVNAVISLIISVVVVLIANRQVVPGDIAASPTTGTEVSVETGAQTDAVVVSGENTPPPDSTPIQSVTYVVESGDTLGAIAAKFSVSLFDLMTANGLTNQDFIQVGQELTIPLGGLPPTTPTFTPAPLPTDTPLPFDPPTPLPTNAARPPEPAATVGPSPTPTPASSLTTTLSIPTSTPLPTSTPAPFNEINVTIDQLIGSGNLAQETVVILNKGAGVSLRDWKLEGSSLGIFVFPDIFLFSGGSIRVHTAAGQNTPSDLFLNQGEPAWPAGTTIVLRDSNSSEISRYKVSSP